MIKVTLAGHVGKTDGLRHVGDGQVLSFSVAANFYDPDAQDKRGTLWVKCSVWGKRAGSLVNHINKGTFVCVTGDLRLREWTDRDGRTRTDAECRVDDVAFKNDAGGAAEQRDEGRQAPRRQAQSTQFADDDIGF